MNSKLVFLFGAGISVPAGLPTGASLTKDLLSNSIFYRHSSGVYLMDEVPEYNRLESDQIFKTIHIIYSYLIEIGIKEPNYEDIFSICSALITSKPLPEHYALEIEINSRLTIILNIHAQGLSVINELYQLMSETCSYINCFIWNKMQHINPLSFYQQNPQSNLLDYLNNLVNLITSKTFKEIHIFTLNHDLVLETLFKKFKIKSIVDGFGIEINGVRYWEPELYNKKCKIKLYKLHGSIDWFLFRREPEVTIPSELGIPADNDFFHAKDVNGNSMWSENSLPHFLTGTESKIREYHRGCFFSLISKFAEVLSKTDKLIVSGYSYGDKGINGILTDWQSDHKERIIINISKDKKRTTLRKKIINSWINEIDLHNLTSTLVIK